MMDHFTKFVQAVVTQDQTAPTARARWAELVRTYGFPGRTVSVEGRDLESKLIQQLCSLVAIHKCRTTPITLVETLWKGGAEH